MVKAISISPWGASFLKGPEDFDDDRDPRFVVPAEDRRPVASDLFPFDDRQSFSGNNGVHVGREKERPPCRIGGGEAGNEIADLAADRFAGLIEFHLGSQRLQFLLKNQGDRLLFGEAVDPNELKKVIGHSLSV